MHLPHPPLPVDPSSTQMLTPVDSSKCMLTSDIRVYKRVSSCDEDDRKERDLSLVDVSIDATVQRVRGVVLVQVVRRLVRYAEQLKDSLDEEMMASAREAANKTAVRTVSVCVLSVPYLLIILHRQRYSKRVVPLVLNCQ